MRSERAGVFGVRRGASEPSVFVFARRERTLHEKGETFGRSLAYSAS